MNIDSRIWMLVISLLCISFIVYIVTTYTELENNLPSESTTTLKTISELSELQITACNSADEGGTCDTKLPRLGLVTKEECCSQLGKCCD